MSVEKGLLIKYLIHCYLFSELDLRITDFMRIDQNTILLTFVFHPFLVCQSLKNI